MNLATAETIKFISNANYYPLIIFAIASFVFYLTDNIDSIKLNKHSKWWGSKELKVDICFAIFNLIIKKYLFFATSIIIWSIASILYNNNEIRLYLTNGLGPLGKFSFIQQISIYLVASDFCSYWIHRAFHHRFLWKYHSIHHSPKQVDWTTAYRFHPLNLALGTILIDVAFIYAGISLDVIVFIKPIDAAFSFFVHANLNCGFGTIKYLIATPVFHRWHHANNSEFNSKNFSATFPLWDIIFGSYYFPSRSTPITFGVSIGDYPKSFMGQILYPFWPKL